MTAVALPFPRLCPRRRSVRLGSTLLGALALTSCGNPGSDEASQRVPVSLTLEQMTTDSELMSTGGAPLGAWAVSPGPERPMSMLLQFEEQLIGNLHTVNLDSTSSSRVMIAPSTLGMVVDGHGELVRVVTRSVADGRYRHLMMTSTDLETWEETALPEEIDCALDAVGGGLVASGDLDGEVRIWDLADDGTVTAMPALAVPEGQEWSVEGIQRSGSTIVVLVMARQGTQPRFPVTVASTDDGATWSEPVALPSEGYFPAAGELLSIADGFLVVGEHDLESTVEPGWRTTRPVAWSSKDGITFEQESIPVPLWGTEGYERDGTGLTPTTPIDWISVDRGSAVLSPDRGTVHLMVHTRDDPRTSTRSPDGTWTTSDLGGTAYTWSTVV